MRSEPCLALNGPLLCTELMTSRLGLSIWRGHSANGLGGVHRECRSGLGCLSPVGPGGDFVQVAEVLPIGMEPLGVLSDGWLSSAELLADRQERVFCAQ